MATSALWQNAFSASFAADVKIRARAWMSDAVLDVDSNPHLVNANNDERDISHAN
jgi:hypothetical protein